jgi:streptogramin lyase
MLRAGQGRQQARMGRTSMNLSKRDLIAGLGIMAGMGAIPAAAQQDYLHGKDLGAAPPQKRKQVPHRKVTTKNLFKVPDAYPNGIAITDDGIWVAEQKAQGYGQSGKKVREAAWLFDWKGRKLKTVLTDSSNTSGFAFGNGHVWMGANGGAEGVYEVDLNGRLISHHQIPLGPANNGGGCHGLLYHDGKLWIVANRIRAILRVDPKSWTPEFIIPITTARWHGIAWTDDVPGGAIWMVTGSSDINRYVMQNGKLHHTTTCGLMKYSATTGELLETAEFEDGTADAHGLAMWKGKLYSCDAGVGPPGFEGTGSPSAGYVFEINFV